MYYASENQAGDTPWHKAIDDLVGEILVDLDISSPPVDAVLALRRLGLEVAIDGSQTTRGRQKSVAGRRAVFLKADSRVERIQWAAAHELGEVNAWKIFERLDEFDYEPTPWLREQSANRFASCFLLPQHLFLDESVKRENHLLELKSLFSTASHELIARRLLEFGEPKVLTIIDRAQTTTRIVGRTGASMCAPMSHAEKTIWEQVHREGVPRQIRADSLKIDVWPIHEQDWKREIVLTSCRDD